MKVEKIDELIRETEKEITRINEKDGEYATWSEESLKEREEFLKSLSSELSALKSKLVNTISEIKKLEEERDATTDVSVKREKEKKIVEKTKDLKQTKKSMDKLAPGKLRDVASSFIAQVDKRVHNAVYREKTKSGKDSKLGSFAWKIHEKLVNFRYNHPFGYFLGEIGAKAAVLTGFALAGFAPALFPVLVGAMAAGTVIRGGTTIYNLIKYHGHPGLIRKFDIQKGSYSENIKNSLFKRKRTKKSISNVKGINLSELRKGSITKSDPIDTKGDDEKKEERVKELLNKLEKVDLTDKSEENIQNLRNLLAWGETLYDSLPEDARATIDKIRELLKEHDKKPDLTDTVAKLNDRLHGLKDEEIDKMSLEQLNAILKIIEPYKDKIDDAAKEKFNKMVARRDALLEKSPVKPEGPDKPIDSDKPIDKGTSSYSSDPVVDAEIRLFIARVNALNTKDFELVQKTLRDYEKLSSEVRGGIPRETLERLKNVYDLAKEFKERSKQAGGEQVKYLISQLKTLTSKLDKGVAPKEQKMVEQSIVELLYRIGSIIEKNDKVLQNIKPADRKYYKETLEKYAEGVKKYASPSRAKIVVREVLNAMGETEYYVGECRGAIHNKNFKTQVILESIEKNYIYNKVREAIPSFDGMLDIQILKVMNDVHTRSSKGR